MIRVGFVLVGSPEAWLGGLNYFRSLFGALASIEDRRIEPVLLTDRQNAAAWSRHFPGVQCVPTSVLSRWSPPWVLRKGVQSLLGRDLLLERRLRGLGVTCLSHSGPLGMGSTIRTLGWIPDFQHLHLPECFSRQELKKRGRAFMRLCRECDRILVSSEDAKKDLTVFCPAALDRVRVLHFVPRMPPPEELPDLETLQRTYGFEGAYFHLPNQFWKHKNHAVVIEALRMLRESGDTALVLATGLIRDYRDPGYSDALMSRVRDAGLENDFRVLGVVPFMDMLGLMRFSRALINPSLFEGWSTTVEEARRLGVPGLLSDLPVHREQAIPGARYFPPGDPVALAAAMREFLGAPSMKIQPDDGDQAYRDFGAAYQALVVELARA